MKKTIETAVIAAAGRGTRFAPWTDEMAKEMLPIGNIPVIQIVMQEMVDAGIKRMILVTNGDKQLMVNHVCKHIQKYAKEKGQEINILAAFQDMHGYYGNAIPLIEVSAWLSKGEDFVYAFADDFYRNNPKLSEPEINSRTEQMMKTHDEFGSVVLACKEVVEDDEYNKYGIVDGEVIDENRIKVSRILEKPGKANAKSNIASTSGYILTSGFMDRLKDDFETFKKSNEPGSNEFMIQPTMQRMIDNNEGIYAQKIENAKFFDTGSPEAFAETIAYFYSKK